MKTNYTYFLTSYTGVITKSFFFIKKHLHRLLLTVFVSALFSMAGNAQQTYSEYSFEETSGEDVLDSNSSNDGKIVDDVTRIDGVKGKGLEFDESGYIRLQDASISDVPDGLTISVWLKPGQISEGSTEAFMGLVMQSGDPNAADTVDSYAIYLNPASNGIGFKTAGTTEAWMMPSSEKLWDGEWHHLVVTYDGAAKAIYLDNELVESVAATGAIASATGNDLLIGAGYDFSPIRMLYTGLLDEVRIYNYGLNHSEITQLYDEVMNPAVEQTFSEYQFEETSGEDVLDSNGSNDGKIVDDVTRIDGVRGKGLEFNGGYINLGEDVFSEVKENITISAWVKPATTGSFMGIVMLGAEVYDTYALYVDPDNSGIGWSTAGTDPTSWYHITEVPDLYDGEWHHLAVTYDGAEKVIYLDKEIVGTEAATGEISSGSGYNLLIGAGRDVHVLDLLYSGSLDEVRIYNSTLTDTEIVQLYDDVMADPGTNIASANLVENIKIFPNPVKSHVNIEFSSLPEGIVDISLFDATGRQLIKREVQNSLETLNLENLARGLYIMKINGSVMHKSVIIKSE
jgi:hypothetical protein